MPPFAGFSDFGDCTTKQKSKGYNDDAAKKICGKLQSQSKDASELDVIFSAIDYNDCIKRAKEFGHDSESAQRICDVVATDGDDSGIKSNTTQDSTEANKQFEQTQDDLDNPDNPANNWLKVGDYSDVEQSQVDRLDIALDIINQIRDNEAKEDDEDTDLTVSNLDIASEIVEKVRDEEQDEAEDDYDDNGYSGAIEDSVNHCIATELKKGTDLHTAHQKCGSDHTKLDLKHGDPNSEHMDFSDQYSSAAYTQPKGTPKPIEMDTNSFDSTDLANTHDMNDNNDGPDFDDMGADESDIEDDPESYDFGDLPNLDDNDDNEPDSDTEALISRIDSFLEGQTGTSGDYSSDDVGNTPTTKKKKKLKSKVEDDSDEEQDNMDKGANLVMQNQFTDPDKLEKYLDTEAINWDSDEEADYNEKSDTKRIDLSYYDDDISKCISEQTLNGLSTEDATTFCNNLANYNGDGGTKSPDEQDPTHYNNKQYVDGSDMPSNVKEAVTIDEALKHLEAYFTREKENLVDPLVGGDGDILQENDIGNNHPENSIGNGDGDGAHTHALGNNGPQYDHFGNKVYNEANTTENDEFTTESNSSLNGNSHITEHMHPAQKQMGTQNLEQIPAEDDNASMRGLGENSVGNIVRTGTPTTPLDNGTPEMTAKPEDAGIGPTGAAFEQVKQAYIDSVKEEYKAAVDKLAKLAEEKIGLVEAKENPMVTNCVKAKMKANDKLSEEDATKQCQKSMGGELLDKDLAQQVLPKSASYEKVEEVLDKPWTKSGKVYSAEQCVKELGGDDDAKTMCFHIAQAYDGNYDSYMADMQIKPFESNDKLFIKAFLLDSSVNLNKWGASPMTLDQNIRSYIGKPLVLRDDFDHPISHDDNLQHQLEYQELFRIGTIIDVVKKGTRYDAIAEITDPHAQRAFKEGYLPLYVSPQLYKLDSTEPDHSMTRWTGTHLAVVKDPAYTIKRATINGECTGESDKCISYLKRAAIIHDRGYGSCGFCAYKVLTSARSN